MLEAILQNWYHPFSKDLYSLDTLRQKRLIRCRDHCISYKFVYLITQCFSPEPLATTFSTTDNVNMSYYTIAVTSCHPVYPLSVCSSPQ